MNGLDTIRESIEALNAGASFEHLVTSDFDLRVDPPMFADVARGAVLGAEGDHLHLQVRLRELWETDDGRAVATLTVTISDPGIGGFAIAAAAIYALRHGRIASCHASTEIGALLAEHGLEQRRERAA